MLGTMNTMPLNISRILQHGGQRHPHATITWSKHSTVQSFTFADTLVRCGGIAHALASMGVKTGDVVSTLMTNSITHFELYLAIPSMGAVLNPINIYLEDDDIARIITATNPALLMVDAHLYRKTTAIVESLGVHTTVIVADLPTSQDSHATHAVLQQEGAPILEKLLDGQPTDFAWPQLDEHAAAAIGFTSGTTGTPKGVVFTHRSIWLHSMQMCMAEAAALSSATKMLLLVPMSHALAWGLPFAAFMAGCSIVLPGRDVQPSHIVDMIQSQQPTIMSTLSAKALALLRYLESHPTDLGKLTEMMVGGSAIAPALIKAYSDRHRVTVMQAWGMTEMSPLGAIARLPYDADNNLTEQQQLDILRTQGRFPAGLQARVVDINGDVRPNNGHSIGEIQVRGPWIATSYLGEDKDPYLRNYFDGDWLRTGDVGSIDQQGFLRISDRLDDAILSGGEWISSLELEQAIVDNDDVADCAVVGIPNPKWGLRPLAVVTVKKGRSVSVEQLRDRILTVIDEWKCPGHWCIVDALPRTSVGKVDKRHIKKLAATSQLDIVSF